MLTVSQGFAVEIIYVSQLDDDTIKTYYPLLSEERKSQIAFLPTAEERRVVLCREIAAIRAVASLYNCPEASVTITLTPEGRMIPGLNKGFLNICIEGDCIVAVATKSESGAAAVRVKDFNFSEAQQMLSDSEIRAVVAASGYSVVDIVNANSCSSDAAIELYAKLIALKTARNACLPDNKAKAFVNQTFTVVEDGIICSEKEVTVDYCEVNKKGGIAVAIIRYSA